MNQNIIPVIEGLLFLSGDEGISITDCQVVCNCDQMSAEDSISVLQQKYANDSSTVFKIIFTSGTYKLVTKKEYYLYFEKYSSLTQNEKLGVGALEILSIVAYNQPITRFAIEQLKGTSTYKSLKLLINKELIFVCGKSQEIGAPNLYSTTEKFLDYIGINSLSDLPPLKEYIFDESKKNLFDIQNLDYKKLTSDLLNNDNTIVLKNIDEQTLAELNDIKTLDIEINQLNKEENNGKITESNSPK